MPAERHLRVTLDLDLDADPIRGQLEREGASPRPFTGWLDLAAALDNARLPDHEAQQAEEEIRP